MKCKIIDYDKEHDNLFFHLGGKLKTDYSIELDDDFIVDMKKSKGGDFPVGIEIMNVKRYLK